MHLGCFCCRSGHALAVRRVRWTANDTHVLSVGGDDRAVFQWKVVRERAEDANTAGKEGEDPDLQVFNITDDDVGLGEPKASGFQAVKPW